MARLCREDKKELVAAMRTALLEQVNGVVLTESADASARNFIYNEATYEQLLNLCFNENREEQYLPASVLEQVAVDTYEQYVQEALVWQDKVPAATKAKAKAAIDKLIDAGDSRADAEAIVARRFGNKLKFKAPAPSRLTKITQKITGSPKAVKSAIKKHPKTAAGLGIGTTAIGTAAALYKRQKSKKK